MKTFQFIFALQLLISTRLFSADLPSGEVIGWGDNVAGQATGISSYPVSNGVTVITDNPYSTGRVVIAGQILSNVVSVSASYFHSMALKSDGTVVGWGGNQAGHATGTATPFPHRTNGPVIVAGRFLSDVTAIASGGSNLALKRDGTVVAWGENAVPAGLSNVVAIAAHEFTSMALKRDGTVVSWTSASWDPGHGRLKALEGLSNVVAVAVGGAGNVAWNTALKKDGTIVVWRHDMSQQERVPDDMTNVVAIAAGTIHTLALKKDGTVMGFGYDEDGQATGVPTNQAPDDAHLSSGLVTIGGKVLNNVQAVAAHGLYSMALKRDGTIVMWGNKRFYRDVPAGLTNVIAIAAGEGFCLAITTNTSFLENKK